MSQTREQVNIYDHYTIDDVIRQSQSSPMGNTQDVAKKLNQLLCEVKKQPLSKMNQAGYDLFNSFDEKLEHYFEQYHAEKLRAKENLIDALETNHSSIRELFALTGDEIPDYKTNLDQFLLALQNCRKKFISAINQPYKYIISQLDELSLETATRAQANKYLCNAIYAILYNSRCSEIWVRGFASYSQVPTVGQFFRSLFSRNPTTLGELRNIFHRTVSKIIDSKNEGDTADHLSDDKNFDAFINTENRSEKILLQFLEIFRNDRKIQQKVRDTKWDTFHIYIEPIYPVNFEKLYHFDEADYDKKKKSSPKIVYSTHSDFKCSIKRTSFIGFR